MTIIDSIKDGALRTLLAARSDSGCPVIAIDANPDTNPAATPGFPIADKDVDIHITANGQLTEVKNSKRTLEDEKYEKIPNKKPEKRSRQEPVFPT